MNRRRVAIIGAVAAVAVVAVVVAGVSGVASTAYTRLHVHFFKGRTTTFDARGNTRSATPGPASGPPSGPLNVVVIGDSVPAGNACGCTPFGERTAHHIAGVQHRTVTAHNFGIGGATAKDALDQLQQPAVRAQVAGADLVIIETGANDFDDDDASKDSCRDITRCFGDQLDRTTDTIDRIVTTVQGLLKNSSAQISLLGYWNVFTDGAVGRSHGSTYVTVSDALTRRLNDNIRGIAEKRHVSYPDVYAAFKGADGSNDPTGYLAADGDHPNNKGHQVLSDAVVAALGDSIKNL